MKCVYNSDGICMHMKCPVCCEPCPVPDTDGICQYEVREEEDERYVLTPKGCLLVALLDNNIHFPDETFENIWSAFSENMVAQGYVKEE
jgi:hypothetical protein